MKQKRKLYNDSSTGCPTSTLIVDVVKNTVAVEKPYTEGKWEYDPF